MAEGPHDCENNNNNISRRNDEAKGLLKKDRVGAAASAAYISAVGDTAMGITRAMGSAGC